MMFKQVALVVTLCFSSISGASDWVDDWFDNAVYDKPTSFNGQKRGYYSAGGFSARVNTTTDYPVSITPPKLNVGCGGIDAFLGGVSFLDKDYLVDKTQAIMQAAPYVALDMAMKTMCKECSDTLAKAEQTINFLNGIQLNECQMAKPIATAAVDQNPEALKGLWTEMTGTKDLNDATTRMWGETTDDIKAGDGVAKTDLKTLISGCPAEFKEIMKNGSIVTRMSKKLGMEKYANTLRGYIGDVQIKAGASDNIPQAVRVLRCEQNNDVSLDDMLHGRSFVKKEDGSCEAAGGDSVYEIVNDKLTSISDSLKQGSALTSAQTNFIFATPYLPVYSMLMQATMENTTNEMVSMLTDLVALHYTYIIFNDLYRNADYAMKRVRITMNTTSTDSTANQCRTDLFLPVVSNFESIVIETKERRELMEGKYNARLKEIQNNLGLSETFRQREQTYRKNNAVSGVK
jgi:conjugative transfer pilus assembly protein TraH